MLEEQDSEQKNLYIPNLNKKYTNSHSRQRAKNFQFNKNKKFFIEKYSDRNIFLFDVLKKGYKPIDDVTKTKLNQFIEEYETYLLSIEETTSENRLKQLLSMINILISKMEHYINKDNFIDFIKHDIFIDQEGINLKNIEPFSLQIDEQRRAIEQQIQKSSIKPGISFADIVKHR
tara:strand:+ start:57 stop:581 length:525 start_codon:yes stop_codon:yes gene_type:complete